MSLTAELLAQLPLQLPGSGEGNLMLPLITRGISLLARERKLRPPGKKIATLYQGKRGARSYDLPLGKSDAKQVTSVLRSPNGKSEGAYSEADRWPLEPVVMRKDPERIGASIHNRRHDGPVDAQRHPRSLEGTNSRVGSGW